MVCGRPVCAADSFVCTAEDWRPTARQASGGEVGLAADARKFQNEQAQNISKVQSMAEVTKYNRLL